MSCQPLNGLPATVPRNDILQYDNFISSEEANKILDLLDNVREDEAGESQSGAAAGGSANDQTVHAVGLGWQNEGFERKRRVQRYSSNSNSNSKSNGMMEKHFGALMDRIIDQIAVMATTQDVPHNSIQRPTHLIIEERQPSSFGGVDPNNKWASKTKAKNKEEENPMTNWSVTTFESDTVCACCSRGGEQTTCCNCYTAQLTIGLPCIQRINKPQTRSVECWDLVSPGHYAQFTMVGNSLTVKRGEVLKEWRGRVDVPFLSEEENGGNGTSSGRSVILTFRCINEQDSASDADSKAKSESASHRRIPIDEMPPLSDLLTIIVTTSPIKSNPSTELLEKTFDTFHFAGHDFAYECRKVIVCDGCRVLEDEKKDGSVSDDGEDEKKDGAGDDTQKQKEDEQASQVKQSNNKKDRKISRKHSNVKQALRNGIATKSQAERYGEFKIALRKICEEANNSRCDNDETTAMSPFRNTDVVELPSRNGYGFALRHVLRHCVHTPYVCVIQHDRTFMRTTPIESVVHCMVNDPDKRIKYVGCSMRSNLMYREIFVGKYGKSAHEELGRMVLRPPELRLDPQLYGPTVPVESIQVYGPHVSNIDKLLKNLRVLSENYKKSLQNRGYTDTDYSGVNSGASGSPYHQLTLTPTLFWYDNTHIVETKHYRDFIFNEKYRMVARGGFVEDKLSPVITKSVERLGLEKGHGRFGCYLLDDHSGLFFTGHLDGGAYMTTAERGHMLSKLKS